MALQQHTLGYLLAITTGLCWAVLAIGLKYALSFASSGSIVWVRMVVASALLFGFLLARNRNQVAQILKRPPLLSILAGLFLAFNYYGYMYGIELTTASNAQIMIQLGPIVLLFAGVFYFKEELKILQWIGVGIALLGFSLFNWDQLLISVANQAQYISGNLWISAAAATWTIYAVFQKILVMRGWTPQQTNLVIYLVCAIVLLPLANFQELAKLGAWEYFILFCLGLNSFIAYGAFAEAMHLIPASKVSLIISCNPLLTIFLMDLFVFLELDFVSAEPLQWRGYAGAVLVVIGVATAVSLRNAKIRRRQAAHLNPN